MPDTPAIPYDLFISYAHRDNVRGQVRELRDAINDNFEGFAGRPLKIFFDEDDIPTMAAWEQRIAKGLDESRLFLAVLSPNFFASDYCRREWEEYTRYEAMRQCLGEGVAPVYFVELPGLETGESEDLITEWVHGPRQWCDLASQTPVEIAQWHDLGKRALEDAHVADRLRELKGELAERLKRADRAKESPTNFHRHNPQFVGRVRELTQLRHAVSEQGSVGVVGHSQRSDAGAVAVHGVGGMGKTELALAYSHAFAWDYPGGRWLAACEHVSDFNLVLRQLADPLGVEFTEEENKDARLAGERILKELRVRGRSLLLLDNVDDPALLTPDVLMRLPRNVHMLATTRMGPMQLAGSPHDHTFVAVDELPMDDALALIRSHQPERRFPGEEDEAAARELVKLLDGFTLAVETAAIYLGRRAGPGVIAAYVERLNPTEILEMSEEAAGDPTVAVRHKEALLERTLEITFETLSVEQMHVLTLGALLPADQIPLPWLRAVEGEGLTSLEISAEGDAMWSQLCESLLSLRLFQKGDDVRVVRMHRMVQELIRKRSKDQASALDSPLVELVKSRRQLTTHAAARAECVYQDWRDQANRWEAEPLHAIALQALQFKDLTEPTIRMANTTAKCLQALGRWIEAKSLFEQGLEAARREMGEEIPVIIGLQSNLGMLLGDLGSLEEGAQLTDEALELAQRSLGEGHPEALIAANNCALVAKMRGDYQRASQLLSQVFATQFNRDGSQALTTAKTANNLAGVLAVVGDWDAAFKLHRAALTVQERELGGDHEDTLTTANDLAFLLDQRGDLEEAVLRLRQVVEGRKKLLSDEHPSTLLSRDNLAVLLLRRGELAAADQESWQVTEASRRVLGPDHPQTLVSLGNRASIMEKRGRLQEALELQREVVGALDRNLGDSHPKTLMARNNLAFQLDQGSDEDRADAHRIFRETLERRRIVLGPDHPDTLVSAHNLACASCTEPLHAEQISRASAEVLLHKSVTQQRVHPTLGMVMSNYGTVLERLGHGPDAVRQRLQSLAKSHGLQIDDRAWASDD
jgi:tetratricopeptide (TPR) repeat protein